MSGSTGRGRTGGRATERAAGPDEGQEHQRRAPSAPGHDGHPRDRRAVDQQRAPTRPPPMRPLRRYGATTGRRALRPDGSTRRATRGPRARVTPDVAVSSSVWALSPVGMYLAPVVATVAYTAASTKGHERQQDGEAAHPTTLLCRRERFVGRGKGAAVRKWRSDDAPDRKRSPSDDRSPWERVGLGAHTMRRAGGSTSKLTAPCSGSSARWSRRSPPISTRFPAAVESYVDGALRAMPEHLRAGHRRRVAAPRRLGPAARIRPRAVDAGASLDRLEHEPDRPGSPVRAAVPLAGAFAEHELPTGERRPHDDARHRGPRHRIRRRRCGHRGHARRGRARGHGRRGRPVGRPRRHRAVLARGDRARSTATGARPRRSARPRSPTPRAAASAAAPRSTAVSITACRPTWPTSGAATYHIDEFSSESLDRYAERIERELSVSTAARRAAGVVGRARARRDQARVARRRVRPRVPLRRRRARREADDGPHADSPGRRGRRRASSPTAGSTRLLRRATGSSAPAAGAARRRRGRGRSTIRADHVFVCGGAIQTPALLQRSGIRRGIGAG